MKNTRPEIRVGARGWNFDHWAGEFYPDDLPEDWRFSFYSNDFQTVLVPSHYLAQFALEDWQEWVEDTTKDFWFFIEVAETDSWKDIEPYLSVFADKLKGIVVAVEKLDSVDSLATLINKLKRVCPVTLRRVGSAVSDQDMETLQSCYEINECWNGNGDSPSWSFNESSALVLRDSSEDNNPETIRQLVEKGLEYIGQRESMLLFFNGSSPRIADMQDARTITELLA